MLASPRELRKNGVLGLNERNANVIQVHNPRRLYPLVDDKLRTKQLALKAGIAVPELYGVVASQHDVRRLSEIVGQRRDFVIKPAHGTGGDGILVVADRNSRREGLYRLVDGNYIGEADIRHHVSNIIGGQYSFVGSRDRALIEYRVETDPVFAAVTFQGVPDIRVLVFQGYPVMAMVRLPTRGSRGKANLHQGAVGAGVDLAHGRTTSGVLGNDIVHEHPDTGEPISGVSIPQWEHLLTLAARCYELTGLGYLGVDIVLDRSLGPLILELNARPGLNIQIANKVGLKSRLERIEALFGEHSVEDKVALVLETFAA
ncbi:MAG: alpha-L-glutamate ligase-like protein [Gammaproteobacteria bacterium]|nr:alpha-L-glutamate ligase-like protein [Gammaproteobacteria bacterium]